MQYVTEDKKRVTVAIPLQLHEALIDKGIGITEGIVKGLELLLKPSTESDQVNNEHFNQEIIKSLEARISSLEDQIKVKDYQLENKDTQMEERLKSLEDQLQVKDSQLEKQAVHIQTLINQKSIEAPGHKKPWWQFW